MEVCYLMMKKRGIGLTLINKFLDEYKNLESAIRLINSEASVFDYEKTLDSKTQEKLKVCRILRNHVQHNVGGDEFVCVTEEQIHFLKSLTSGILIRFSSSADLTDKTKTVKLSDTLLQASRKFSEQNELPLLDKAKLVGCISAQQVLNLISKTKELNSKLEDIIKKLDEYQGNYIVIESETYNAELSVDKHNYVVDRNQKYVGEIFYDL